MHPVAFPQTTSGNRPRCHEGRAPQPRRRESDRHAGLRGGVAGFLLTEHTGFLILSDQETPPARGNPFSFAFIDALLRTC